jgi:trigger factor
MEDTKIKIAGEKDCVQTISVELPVAKVKEKIEEAFKSVQAQVKLPGFRPGKAPIELVKNSFKDAAYERAQDFLLREGVSEAIKSKKIQPMQSPVIQTVTFSPDKPFQFEFQVEVAPTVKLGNYKGFKLTKNTKPVSDDDIKKTLDNVANINARLAESSAESLANNHFAVLDYEGFLDGKSIEGAKAQNFLMDMSAPQAIAGLSEGLTGAKPNEEREVKVKFPDDSPSKELAGKEAIFKVKLQAIKEKKVQTVDDEFAKDMGFESLEQMKSKIREKMEAEQKQAGERDIEKQITDKLVEEHSFPIPQSLVDKQMEYLNSRQRDRLNQQGIPPEEQNNLLERLKADVKREAGKDVRLAYILSAIGDAEKIEVTPEDLTARINAILQSYEPKDRANAEKMLRQSYQERIQTEVRDQKIFQWLISHSKIKESVGGV